MFMVNLVQSGWLNGQGPNFSSDCIHLHHMATTLRCVLLPKLKGVPLISFSGGSSEFWRQGVCCWYLSWSEWGERKEEGGGPRGTRRQRRLTTGRIFQEQEIFLKSRRFSWRTGEMTLITPKEWWRHCFHAGGMSGDEQLARFENQIKNECKLL